MTTIQELKAQVDREQAEAAAAFAADTAARQERERKEAQDALATALDVLDIAYVRSETDSSVTVEGYIIRMRSQYIGGEFSSFVSWLYVQKGRSVTVNREVGRTTFVRDLLSAMAEADELDRLDNRPYVEKLLADIRAGGWDDNYAENDGQFLPWKDELTAAWDAWNAAQHKWYEENKPQPTVEELAERIAVLEANAAAIDALAKRVTALEAAQGLPVVSWLESTVATISQFAKHVQGEWASMQPLQLPDELLKYRALEDEMDALADEIAAATNPVATTERIVTGTVTFAGMPYFVGTNTPTLKVTPAPIVETVPVRAVPVYPTNVDQAIAQLDALILRSDTPWGIRGALRDVVQSLQFTTEKPAPVQPIAEGDAQILHMDGSDSNVLFYITPDVWKTLNRVRADRYSYPIRVVFYPADSDETAVQS